jgi:hypothetical protein
MGVVERGSTEREGCEGECEAGRRETRRERKRERGEERNERALWNNSPNPPHVARSK